MTLLRAQSRTDLPFWIGHIVTNTQSRFFCFFFNCPDQYSCYCWMGASLIRAEFIFHSDGFWRRAGQSSMPGNRRLMQCGKLWSSFTLHDFFFCHFISKLQCRKFPLPSRSLVTAQLTSVTCWKLVWWRNQSFSLRGRTATVCLRALQKINLRPSKNNCVQLPRICLFRSLQMRLWSNRVTFENIHGKSISWCIT